MIATMSYGGRPPRKIDKLHMYRRGFRDGSVRKGVYEHEMRKAVLAQRDQNEPLEVLAEIQAKLREYLWETSMTRQSRLDAEFDRLQQGSIRHSEFKLAWEKQLQSMKEAAMEIPGKETLYRKYLAKLNPSYRTPLMQKDWRLDGPDLPARRFTTWQEIAKAVNLMLEERQDIQASSSTGDKFMALAEDMPSITSGGKSRGGPKGQSKGGATCRHCGAANDHTAGHCPRKAAESRYANGKGGPTEYDALMTKYSQSGKVCDRCQMPGHEAKHHTIAVSDQVQRARQDEREKAASKTAASKTKANSKSTNNRAGKGKGKEERSQPVPPEGMQMCRFGAKCQSVIQTGKCDRWHSKEDYAVLRKTHLDFKAGTYKAPFDLAARKTQAAEGKGNGKGGKRGQQNELNGESFRQLDPAGKPKAKGKAKAEPAPKRETVSVTSGTKESGWMLSEEICNLTEQITHHESNVRRAGNTVEIGDYFGVGTHTAQDACYALGSTLEIASLAQEGRNFGQSTPSTYRASVQLPF